MRSLRAIAPLFAAVALILPASASAASQTLTVEKTGTGTVTSLPFGIECGSTCTAPFAEGTGVLLLAYPGPNAQAVKWSGCDAISEGNCKVTMGSARKVTATFDPIPRQLSVSKAGMGTGTVTSSPSGIQCGPTCQAIYDQGTSVTLTGSPSLGSEAVKWAGCDSVDLEDKCTVAVSAAKSVTATFKLPAKQLTVTKAGAGTGTVTSSPAGIICGATCSAPFEGSSSVTLTGSPGPSSLAPTWAGCDSVTGEGKCVVAMSAAKGVTATFGLVSHQLVVAKTGEGGPSSTITSSPAGINCSSACQAGFEHNTSVTLTATPGLHVKAAQWSGCTSIVAGKCKVTMSEAKSVSAGFELEAGYAFNLVTIEKIGTGQGTVSSSPGQIACGAICSDRFLTQTVLTLTATPAPGSVFARWSGGGCKGAAPCTSTVKAPKTVKAIFTAVGTRTLSVTRAGTGQGTVTAKAFGIDCGSACSAQVPAAKALTLTAKAKGSAFGGWSGACSGTAKTCKVKMTEAKGVTATFTAPPAPPPTQCVVPKLARRSLAQARQALAAAHCTLGKVTRPKARNGRKPALVIRSFSPAPGTTLAAGAAVDVRLGRAKKHRRG